MATGSHFLPISRDAPISIDYDHARPSLDSTSQLPHTQAYAGMSDWQSLSATHGHSPYYARHSELSLTSDSEAYPVGGRRGDGEQYAEDIPLHQPDTRPDWTPYPACPTSAPTTQRDTSMLARNDRNWRRGFFRKKVAWVTYTLTTVQVAVFIAELVKSAQLTGSPIETKPVFNPMIGPSPYIQINMGARFVPCMKNVAGLQDSDRLTSFSWHCPNSTSNDRNDPRNHCSLSELCGFGGVPNPHPGGSLADRPQPNQWFRFIIPMFLHGGFIHIGFNQLVQLTMGADMERMIGWWRYALVYVASGIFGFVLGGNYAAPGIPSTGCSGALFGILSLFILDLLYTWKERPSAWVELIIMVLGVGVSFVLGLLPGLDNFSHIGGSIMGLALGLSILRSPKVLRKQIEFSKNPYAVMSGGAGPGGQDENKALAPELSLVDRIRKRRGSNPSGGISSIQGFFRGRKPLWWVWWLVRTGSLVAVLVGFIMLIINFYKYYQSNCSWCYRLSCLPVNGWCHLGELDFGGN